MTKEEMQQEALIRARANRSFANYEAIISGFMAKGIPADQITPRENVLTFHAWKALGRSVKKGEHGVKVVTFIECSKKTDAEDPNSKRVSVRKPKTTTVFHISQTEERA